MSLDHPRFGGGGGGSVRGAPPSSGRFSSPAPYPYRTSPSYGHYHHRSYHHHHYRDYLDPDALHLAYDCILGLPFRGSLAHVGVVGANRPAESTCVRGRGQGPADVRWAGGQSASLDPLVVHAISSGLADGNQARLIVNGVDYSLNGRGINMVLIDPGSHDIRSASFDTHLYSGDGNAALQKFAADAALLPGWVFALAVKDDAATNLTLDSRLALESLGVDLGANDNAAALQKLLTERRHGLPPRETSILLNLAARVDAVRCLDVLVQYGWGVNVHAVTGLQNTPLHDAVRRGNKAAARALFALGADSTLFNRDRRSADDLARALYKAPSAIDYARSVDADERDLADAICRDLGLV